MTALEVYALLKKRIDAGGSSPEKLKEIISEFLMSHPELIGGKDLGIVGAEIGKLIKVKSVDASGKPTAWEISDDLEQLKGIVYVSDTPSDDPYKQFRISEESEVATFVEEKDFNQITESLGTLQNTKVGYSEVQNGQLLMYSDATKEHLLATLDLPSGGGSTTDVQINGTSVTENGVANIPIANINNFGVVKVRNIGDPMNGVSISNNGILTIQSLTEAFAPDRTTAKRQNMVITGGTLDVSLRYAMCDGKGAAWTEAEQANARERLGIVTLTQEEYDLIESPSDGTIYVIVG